MINLKKYILDDSIYMKLKTSKINLWWLKSEQWVPVGGEIHWKKLREFLEVMEIFIY